MYAIFPLRSSPLTLMASGNRLTEPADMIRSRSFSAYFPSPFLPVIIESTRPVAVCMEFIRRLQSPGLYSHTRTAHSLKGAISFLYHSKVSIPRTASFPSESSVLSPLSLLRPTFSVPGSYRPDTTTRLYPPFRYKPLRFAEIWRCRTPFPPLPASV